MDVSENGLSIVHTRNDPRAIQYFDACTGSLTMIGAHGTSSLGGIAFGPDGRLFGIGGNDELVEFDLATGRATSIGNLGIDIGTSGLAWDCTNQRMFGADGSGDRVFEIDRRSGHQRSPNGSPLQQRGTGIRPGKRPALRLDGSALYRIEPSTGTRPGSAR